VTKAASESLVPVTLELGGKSPTIVAKGHVHDGAVSSMVFGKLLSGGQTCIAPGLRPGPRVGGQRLRLHLRQARQGRVPRRPDEQGLHLDRQRQAKRDSARPRRGRPRQRRADYRGRSPAGGGRPGEQHWVRPRAQCVHARSAPVRASPRLDSGIISLNRPVVSDPAAPVGGTKQSGLGREGGHEGMLEFTESNSVAVES
jgi:acyl-CoA reductase-like NAD-dependent aldehyde dehydrogenase